MSKVKRSLNTRREGKWGYQSNGKNDCGKWKGEREREETSIMVHFWIMKIYFLEEEKKHMITKLRSKILNKSQNTYYCYYNVQCTPSNVCSSHHPLHFIMVLFLFRDSHPFSLLLIYQGWMWEFVIVCVCCHAAAAAAAKMPFHLILGLMWHVLALII